MAAATIAASIATITENLIDHKTLIDFPRSSYELLFPYGYYYTKNVNRLNRRPLEKLNMEPGSPTTKQSIKKKIQNLKQQYKNVKLNNSKEIGSV